MKRNDGFTLVELLCAIVAGSIVTAATATILLLGLRMNANATKTATQDNQVVIGLSVLSDIAKENKIEVVDNGLTVSDDENTDPWSIIDADTDQIYYGFDGASIQVNGMPLIENVKYASVVAPETGSSLLKITLIVDGDEYPLSIRLRTGQTITIP